MQKQISDSDGRFESRVPAFIDDQHFPSFCWRETIIKILMSYLLNI